MERKEDKAGTPLVLTESLAAKLAAICVSVNECLVFGFQYLDRHATSNLLSDAEVKEWLVSLGPLAPVMRSRVTETKKPH